MLSAADYLKPNPYPGRGIMLGLTPDGTKAVLAYFIMGRSENSRNRVFAEEPLQLKTQAHDPAKLADPSLVIYTALKVLENRVIVTNGDQTDTIYEALRGGNSFEQALQSRCYEPDSPHFTPRISGLMTIEEGRLKYKLSILKKGGKDDCRRFFFDYAEPRPGEGHIIHTYMGDGYPLPCFSGEPVSLTTRDGINDFTEELWEALDGDNRVALYVRYTDLTEYPRAQSKTIDRFGGNSDSSMCSHSCNVYQDMP
ncbi:MAG: IMP cyclohydrolase [Clostridiales bacterium]|nr:IMP cyclohydrolase [Clostridiales bacterium]